MKSLFAAFLSGSASIAFAQIPVSPGSAYTQDFDSLANTGTAQVPWTDNSTLPGWYAYRSSSPLTSYGPSSGPSDGLASYGLDGASDRALGTGLDLTTGSYIYFGARFVNSSASIIGSFSVLYDGEQWFKSSNPPNAGDSLTFSYQIFDSGTGTLTANTGWVNVSALTFTSLINTFSASSFLNGNLPANRTSGIYSSITGISLSPGQELWIRWTATNLPSYKDQSLAVDNLAVNFNAIPEPASFAAILGASIITLCGLRRPSRKAAHGLDA